MRQKTWQATIYHRYYNMTMFGLHGTKNKHLSKAPRLLPSLFCLWLLALPAYVAGDAAVQTVCQLIGNKLSSVSVQECLDRALVQSGAYTNENLAIVYKEYPPLTTRQPQARILLIGGIHGDEYASFSVVFKWMEILDRYHSGLFHWRIAPAVNLDGLLRSPAVRTNSNGVDLNRNLASADWEYSALSHWREQTASAARRYPGTRALSENESRWLTDEIKQFKPDVIVSLHSPYGLVDYDGPAYISPPASLGSLPFVDLQTFPGSLGRYAGEDLQTPVLTIELASSRYMPSEQEIRAIWRDLIAWLKRTTEVGQGK